MALHIVEQDFINEVVQYKKILFNTFKEYVKTSHPDKYIEVRDMINEFTREKGILKNVIKLDANEVSEDVCKTIIIGGIKKVYPEKEVLRDRIYSDLFNFEEVYMLGFPFNSEYHVMIMGGNESVKENILNELKFLHYEVT